MIGETDAVLRSMCQDVDSTNQQQPTSTTGVNQTSPTLSVSPIVSSSSSTSSSSEDTNHRIDAKKSSNTELEHLTRNYLDTYKEQLEASRRELTERMETLEREKERVGARVSEVTRKREQAARKRRSAAVEAFRLERERELRSAQLAKIDELRSRLDELNSASSSFGTARIVVEKKPKTLSSASSSASDSVATVVAAVKPVVDVATPPLATTTTTTSSTTRLTSTTCLSTTTTTTTLTTHLQGAPVPSVTYYTDMDVTAIPPAVVTIPVRTRYRNIYNYLEICFVKFLGFN